MVPETNLYIAIYDVYFEKGSIQSLTRKYKLYKDEKEAQKFIAEYNVLMKEQNREILHSEIHVANWGYSWEAIEEYREEMGYK